MNWAIRNIGLHLWLTMLFSIPAVFLILTMMNTLGVVVSPTGAAGIIILVCFLGIGFSMNLITGKLIANLLNEAQAWERSGVPEKAEKIYSKAVCIFDSFLLWPFSGKRVAGRICGEIARFHVDHDQSNRDFESATAAYLKWYPEDKEIALSWLRKIRDKKEISQMEQAVLTDLVRRYYTHPEFYGILADICLRMRRKDAAARKLYQYLPQSPGISPGTIEKIEQITGKPGPTLAMKKTEIPLPKKKPDRINFKTAAAVLISRPGGVAKKMANQAADLVIWCGRIFSGSISFFGKSQKGKFYLKFGILTAMVIWLFVFMAGTVLHLFKSKPGEEVPVQQVTPELSKPFTIQVAAYLKQKHAVRYVNLLKEKGIDARMKKVDGGGKSWYLVRVSQFADKQSAYEYGRKLKNEEIIDDFFVNNK